jgi:hypothetical protein
MGFAAVGDTQADAARREQRAIDCMPNSRTLFDNASGKFVGSLTAVTEQLRAYSAAGVSRVYLNHFDRKDLQAIEIMGQLARILASPA